MDLNALMRRIQQGDKEAFATLYTRYDKTVYRIALEATGNDAEAKQVVVAVFREMYQTIRSKGPYLGDLYAWLDALTAKQIRLRRLTQEQRGEQEAPPPQSVPAQPVPEGRRHYTEEEAKAIAERARERLPEEPEEEAHQKGGAAVTALLSAAAVVLLWVLVGLLGSLGILPQWDLGFNWFNRTVFKFF